MASKQGALPPRNTRFPIKLGVMGYPIEMQPTGEVRWHGTTLQQAWVPKHGGQVIWHDVQVVDEANNNAR